jgi:hypothetical protein
VISDAQGLTVTAVVVGLVVAVLALVLFVWPQRCFYPLLGLGRDRCGRAHLLRVLR